MIVLNEADKLFVGDRLEPPIDYTALDLAQAARVGTFENSRIKRDRTPED